jgi:Amt family ammonium transporter
MRLLQKISILLGGLSLILFMPLPALAAEESAVNAGDTGFILVCAALVMLMTPGLALFYGGMVRRKNVLSILMQCFAVLALVVMQWVLFGIRFLSG